MMMHPRLRSPEDAPATRLAFMETRAASRNTSVTPRLCLAEHSVQGSVGGTWQRLRSCARRTEIPAGPYAPRCGQPFLVLHGRLIVPHQLLLDGAVISQVAL